MTFANQSQRTASDLKSSTKHKVVIWNEHPAPVQSIRVNMWGVWVMWRAWSMWGSMWGCVQAGPLRPQGLNLSSACTFEWWSSHCLSKMRLWWLVSPEFGGEVKVWRCKYYSIWQDEVLAETSLAHCYQHAIMFLRDLPFYLILQFLAAYVWKDLFISSSFFWPFIYFRLHVNTAPDLRQRSCDIFDCCASPVSVLQWIWSFSSLQLACYIFSADDSSDCSWPLLPYLLKKWFSTRPNSSRDRNTPYTVYLPCMCEIISELPG